VSLDLARIRCGTTEAVHFRSSRITTAAGADDLGLDVNFAAEVHWATPVSAVALYREAAPPPAAATIRSAVRRAFSDVTNASSRCPASKGAPRRKGYGRWRRRATTDARASSSSPRPCHAAEKGSCGFLCPLVRPRVGGDDGRRFPDVASERSALRPEFPTSRRPSSVPRTGNRRRAPPRGARCLPASRRSAAPTSSDIRLDGVSSAI